jgi:hypothetical protein
MLFFPIFTFLPSFIVCFFIFLQLNQKPSGFPRHSRVLTWWLNVSFIPRTSHFQRRPEVLPATLTTFDDIDGEFKDSCTFLLSLGRRNGGTPPRDKISHSCPLLKWMAEERK